MDQQREPQTERLFETLGIEKIFFNNTEPYIENGYEDFCKKSPTDWIFRLDCDEIPSIKALKYLNERSNVNEKIVYGFPRHQLKWKNNFFLTANNTRFLPENQRQWRFFNRKYVEFDQTIHTPGFKTNEHFTPAPIHASLYHLPWLFLTKNDLVKKAAKYDQNGQRLANRESIMFDHSKLTFEKLNDPLLSSLYQEFLVRKKRKGLLDKLFQFVKF